jgi:hypothetical protein
MQRPLSRKQLWKKPLTLGPYRNFLLATLLNTASVNTEHLQRFRMPRSAGFWSDRFISLYGSYDHYNGQSNRTSKAKGARQWRIVELNSR